MTESFKKINTIELPPQALQEWNDQKLDYLKNEKPDALITWHKKWTHWFDEATIIKIVCAAHNCAYMDARVKGLEQGLGDPLTKEEHAFYELNKKELEHFFQIPKKKVEIKCDNGEIRDATSGVKLQMWNPWDPSYKEKVDEMVEHQNKMDEENKRLAQEMKVQRNPKFDKLIVQHYLKLYNNYHVGLHLTLIPVDTTTQSFLDKARMKYDFPEVDLGKKWTYDTYMEAVFEGEFVYRPDFATTLFKQKIFKEDKDTLKVDEKVRVEALEEIIDKLDKKVYQKTQEASECELPETSTSFVPDFSTNDVTPEPQKMIAEIMGWTDTDKIQEINYDKEGPRIEPVD